MHGAFTSHVQNITDKRPDQFQGDPLCQRKMSATPSAPEESLSPKINVVEAPEGQTAGASIPAAPKDNGVPQTDLPGYSQRLDPDAPRLPSYASATHKDPRKKSMEELHPNEDERLASLIEFAETKKMVADNFGGHKGVAEGPPNDPLKVFKWAKRKIGGEKGEVWHKMTVEEREQWEADGGGANPEKGEVSQGDMDTSRIA